MTTTIANGFYVVNSQWLIPRNVANGYDSCMRGADKRANRAARLRLLNEQHTYEEMASRIGGKANPAYLSQIGNEVVGKGRKTPRGLSDDYATRIEQAFSLEEGWFDLPIGKSPQGTQANVEPGPDIRGFVPLISWVTAGAWSAVTDPYEIGDAEQWVPCPIPHGHHTFVLRVRGESMEPEYRDGDWIFVDPDRDPVNGSHIVVRMEDAQEATFKKLVVEGGDRYLMALNPAWPERVIRINGNATIVGVVIFSGKPRI